MRQVLAPLPFHLAVAHRIVIIYQIDELIVDLTDDLIVQSILIDVREERGRCCIKGVHLCLIVRKRLCHLDIDKIETAVVDRFREIDHLRLLPRIEPEKLRMIEAESPVGHVKFIIVILPRRIDVRHHKTDVPFAHRVLGHPQHDVVDLLCHGVQIFVVIIAS